MARAARWGVVIVAVAVTAALAIFNPSVVIFAGLGALVGLAVIAFWVRRSGSRQDPAVVRPDR